MKARCFIALAALCILLSLGGSRLASAASVTGAGIVRFGGAPFVMSVSARSGSGGAQGVMHVQLGQGGAIANVIDLCVQGNQAAVIGQITHSTFGFATVGDYAYFVIEDNGRTGDRAIAFPNSDLIPCANLLLFERFPITSGNFTVTP
jgi:hypothetical protein